MLLAVDIGNTNITLGLFAAEQLKATWRISTDSSRTSDEYGLLVTQMIMSSGLDPKTIQDICMCSVVPPLTPPFDSLCNRYFNTPPLIVGAGTKTGIKINYDGPRDVGADRIIDATAAVTIYGGPIIVVDLGTATVFDAITSKGEYIGGAIAPGIGVSGAALFRSTSQLRRVELIPPETAIGRNTQHSIQSGLVLGYSELIKGMIKRFKHELDENSHVIATGGMSDIIANEVGMFDQVDQDLTLKGLQIVHKMNS